ncbi:predicted protein [Plenodomus lingam JN3]|uniref:Predicted protein n=1 Tax=Leptosphaeria maculans (strain JN3 / isolate v23.1.3 / race Av1-4-5-6-7-8) TaxID=985895 RepID=E5ABE8_LEPMJ|nr:predicted protein [Plenodomus lingam JN3]CBY00989.1 predicted protein [Plenodomus lingam JN3]
MAKEGQPDDLKTLEKRFNREPVEGTAPELIRPYEQMAEMVRWLKQGQIKVSSDSQSMAAGEQSDRDRCQRCYPETPSFSTAVVSSESTLVATPDFYADVSRSSNTDDAPGYLTPEILDEDCRD